MIIDILTIEQYNTRSCIHYILPINFEVIAAESTHPAA